MTRKDYRLLAAALRDARPRPVKTDPDASRVALMTWEATVDSIVAALAGANASFRRDYFEEAAGL